jgi:hypothetical protein
MSGELTRRPYVTPEVIRIKLEHQQAVLSLCSINATTLITMDGTRCTDPANGDCRRQMAGAGKDDSDSS